MAKPSESYPESATHGARNGAGSDGEGEAALRAALDDHGDELAGVVERTDELEELLTTAILVAASADEDDLAHITDSTANAVAAADGLTTEAAAELAAQVGDNGDELSSTLETLLELERDGHTDDLVRIATAFAGSLSAGEVEELATMLEDNGSDIVEAVDVLLDLTREDHLEDLVATAKTLSALQLEPAAVEGANTVLAAVGDAQRDSEPVSLFGMVRGLRSADARAGLGYLLAILKSQGRRLRGR